jgi:glyoxylase-like metal-dependent hydrolase (beta-lactamase superfamily II)
MAGSPADRTGHVTVPPAALLDELPSWATLVRAPNPGPMTLDGTNTWVLRGEPGGPAIVVDPGPLDEEHLQAVAAHRPIEVILLTHGHSDHTDGVARLVELTDAVVVNSRAPLVACPGLDVERLITPGHTADSVSFEVTAHGQRAVLTGDTILGRGTTVVAWPDGELGDYLESLEDLAELGSIPVLPGHGPPLADCGAAARFYLAHRRARLDQVRAARAAGARTAADVVHVVYADVDRSLWPAAEWSVRAQLAYLDRESGRPSARLDPA